VLKREKVENIKMLKLHLYLTREWSQLSASDLIETRTTYKEPQIKITPLKFLQMTTGRAARGHQSCRSVLFHAPSAITAAGSLAHYSLWVSNREFFIFVIFGDLVVFECKILLNCGILNP
jgi:hypothetical protein